ncbi:MAG: hypothetical protein AAFU49_20500, partial [Pseudomonadota bacterium]
MIAFSSTVSPELAMMHSPIVRGLAMTLDYTEEHGGIPLTPSKAFKRVFVEWAAAAFEWPGWTTAELYVVNKVLNEVDFPPLGEVHDLLLAAKIGRRYKGKLILTRSGKAFLGQPARIFSELIPFYLFAFDHLAWSRNDSAIPINGDVYLNVLNVEVEDGAAGGALRRKLFGEPDPRSGFDEVMSALYVGVLRPLCWGGLIREDPGRGFGSEERIFTKTPLWRAGLSLDTDQLVRPTIR